jgi:hypothetical protein
VDSVDDDGLTDIQSWLCSTCDATWRVEMQPISVLITDDPRDNYDLTDWIDRVQEPDGPPTYDALEVRASQENEGVIELCAMRAALPGPQIPHTLEQARNLLRRLQRAINRSAKPRTSTQPG